MSDDELELVDLTIPSSPPTAATSSPIPRSIPSTITAATPLVSAPPSSASLHPLFRPDDILRRFSPAEILPFYGSGISKWFLFPLNVKQMLSVVALHNVSLLLRYCVIANIFSICRTRAVDDDVIYTCRVQGIIRP